MWNISGETQALSFLCSFLLGAGLCLFYDIFRCSRKVRSFSAVSVFFCDLIFSVVSAFCTFILLLIFTGGEIRLFILFGEASGFLICRLTLSKIVSKPLCFCMRAFFKLIRICAGFTERFCSSSADICEKALNFIKNVFKNAKNRKKTLETEDTDSVY